MKQLKKSDFSIGQTVYLRIIPHSNEWRRIKDEDLENPEKQIVEATVLKVGNKYITANANYRSLKFDLTDNGTEATEYSKNYELYLEREDIIKDIIKERKSNEIRKSFEFSWQRNKFSYEQINAVYNILFPETEN